MHNLVRNRIGKLTVLIVCLLGLALPLEVLAQAKRSGIEKSALCTRDNALEMIRSQVDLTKTFDDQVRRITVLIRAADLLWAYQRDKARAVFIEAFELAREKENKQTLPSSLILAMQTPDQRYRVIAAVAKNDPALAKELTRRILSSSRESETLATTSSIEKTVGASRLLQSAYNLL